ncbi:hypothetical protein [Nocardia terpenica]|uniref:TetR family transcriptional regulator n=1 Tax=Nocardia terpenica TaxID=455432 RepID=A0A6G9ZB70_9NOCA|nr:hypothetical protein [Nocardia terpenica]QIS22670.1 hypothetical protein F6W96_34335 [Nocardia terpenica]
MLSRGPLDAEILDHARRISLPNRADGSVRVDATVPDLYMIIGAVATIGRDGIGDRQRFIEIALEGLRGTPESGQG